MNKNLPETAYFEAVGRRKTSVARVRVFNSGRLSFSINGKPFDGYFRSKDLQRAARMSLEAAGLSGKVGVSAILKGGGIHSQAEALSHGIARALVKKDAETHKSILKKLGFMTRDARVKERRKFGLKKARKAPQWSKR